MPKAKPAEPIAWKGSEDLRALLVPIADLAHDPANVRRHGERNREAIKASLMRFGQQKPVVCDRDGIVRAGNGTLAEARELGWSHVAATRSDLTTTDLVGYAIADNRTAELAEWDADGLTDTLKALEADGFDLDAAGFNQHELDALLKGLAVPSEDDWSNAADAIPDGDKSPFEQMTFTLSKDQAESVRAAMDAAKDAGTFVDTGNENSNGNALARIAETYLGHR